MENTDPEFTDCRTETGITVGLVDALISIARVLSKRNMDAEQVQEALIDLRQDEDIIHLTTTAKANL